MFTHSVNVYSEQQDGGDSDDDDNCSSVHLGLEHTSKYFDGIHSPRVSVSCWWGSGPVWGHTEHNTSLVFVVTVNPVYYQEQKRTVAVKKAMIESPLRQ